MAQKIEAILFDFGGVFTVSPFGAVEKFAGTIGATPEQLAGLVFGSYHADTDHAWHQLERGEISLEQARDQILAAGNEQGLEVDLYQVFGAMAEDMSEDGGVNQLLVDYVTELAGTDYTLGIITNNLKEFSDGWRSLFPVNELFDFVVDSSEVGLRKPNPAIYHHALERAELVDPSKAVFLDDFLGNVTAARDLGLHAIHVDGGEDKTVADLRRFLGE